MKQIRLTCGQLRNNICEFTRDQLSKNEIDAQRKTRAAIAAFNKDKKASVEENVRVIENSKRQFLAQFQRELPVDTLVDLVTENDLGLKRGSQI